MPICNKQKRESEQLQENNCKKETSRVNNKLLTTQNGENQRNRRLQGQQHDQQQENHGNLNKTREDKQDGQQKGQQSGTARILTQGVICLTRSQPKPPRTRGKHNRHARRNGDAVKYRI